MTQKVTLQLTGENEFSLANGQKVEDLNPKQALLYATAYCAGLTVTHVMAKERITPKNFTIEITGELEDIEPMAAATYTSFNLNYNVECANTKDEAKAARAIELGHDKYCGMVKMMRKVAPVTYEVMVVNTTPQTVYAE